MGGIGKTALAIEAAHQARAKGWFPGGTLFVDLRGYDDNPVTAEQAVQALLDALGVPGPDLPPTAARQYDMFSTLLADRQHRMLLILDNASDPAQYLPLLPGVDGHQVLITSRDRPDSLPVRLINLESLPPDDSAALITRALHDADERDDRPTREPEALRELTSLCGHLPLALLIAAAMLRKPLHRDIAWLVTEIEKAGDAMAILDNGTNGTDQYGRSLALRPVLETSYRRLPADQARLLRFLSLAPAAETTPEAVAALAGLDTDTTLTLLEELAATHLVSPVRVGDGSKSVEKWRLHDLVRVFMAGVVASDVGLAMEGQSARKRLLGFYCRWAGAADARLRSRPGNSDAEQFAHRIQALTWMDGERAGLVSAMQWAREEQHAKSALRLAVHLAEYLLWRRHYDDWISVSGAAQEAANRIGDHLGEAWALNDLGNALRSTGRTQKAIDALTRAHDLYRDAGDHLGQAVACNGLGIALRHADRAEDAIDVLTRARDLSQKSGDRLGEADAWNSLGNTRNLEEAGQAEMAIDDLTRARDLYQDAGDRHREALAWNNLGLVLWEAGRVGEETEAFHRALEIHEELGDLYRMGQTLGNLAAAHSAGYDPAKARTYWLKAADVFDRADAPDQAALARTRAANWGWE
ncbi:tetratricopeptide repeat protein [Streptomyces sp. B21-083]|uniref:tetratricopeptide repeat protein n=1 Tax=Streptomyces sp. B21-083 TaxID=3039410 RepID=UPI003FA765A4